MENIPDIPYEKLIEEWVEYNNDGPTPMFPIEKIDILERFVEVARFHLNRPQNDLSIEEFIQGTCSATFDNKLYFGPPKNSHLLGAGTPPILLQPQLLLFLLLHHKSDYTVIDIISNFISKIRGDLTILDFKKTRTGVTRCYTNTRFAANTLRDYGLLKFTKKEAYKTWVLSLPGFLVAAKIFKSGSWKLGRPDKQWSYRIHKEILEAWESINRYDKFVSQLKEICMPEEEVFVTFKPTLEKAYKKLSIYWEILNDPGLNVKEKKIKSLNLIKEIEESDKMESFYREFSDCLNIEALMKNVSGKK